MAKTASQRRTASRPARRASAARSEVAKRSGKAAKTPAKALKSPGKAITKLGAKAAVKILRALGRKAVEAGAEGLRSAADRTALAGRNAVESGLSRRLPIQVSIDVAVPLAFAWEEWMTFESMTEGVHRIEDVERDGDRLIGRTAAPRSAEWEAEIVDEREQESLAWRSIEGSDCAGLATFHRLSDRLTRIELDLDVLPTNPGETLALSLHLAHRRAQAELRRFKARVEFINPDVYETSSRNGHKPENETDQ